MKRFFKYAFLFLLLPHLAKSQADDKTVFLSINKQAAVIDEALNKINTGLKADRHKEMDQQTKRIKAALSAIETQSNSLSPDNSEKLSAITNGFKTDLVAFGKLADKSALFDNDKTMAAAFAPLISRQSNLRDFLRNAYSAVVAVPEKEKKPDTILKSSPPIVAQTPVAQPEQQQSVPQKTDLPVPVAGESDQQVLTAIREAQSQIGGWVDSLRPAVKKNQFPKIRMLTKNIASAAVKIEDLSLLLKDEQKNNIKTLASGLKQYAANLQVLSTKGHAAHEQMHEALALIETRFGVLSTGIRILK